MGAGFLKVWGNHCLPEVVLCDRAADSAYRLRLMPCIGSLENGNYFKTDDAAFEIKILFTQKEAGIESAFDRDGNAPEDPVYYNLNGEIVTNPERGIYIVKENGRFHKKFLLTPVACGGNDR